MTNPNWPFLTGEPTLEECYFCEEIKWCRDFSWLLYRPTPLCVMCKDCHGAIRSGAMAHP